MVPTVLESEFNPRRRITFKGSPKSLHLCFSLLILPLKVVFLKKEMLPLASHQFHQKKDKGTGTQFGKKPIKVSFLRRKALRKMMLVYAREIEFHILSDIFQTCSSLHCSSWLPSSPHPILPTAPSDLHQGFLKSFPFRWLLALVS